MRPEKTALPRKNQRKGNNRPIDMSRITFSEFVWIWNHHQSLKTPALHIEMAGWLDICLLKGEKKCLIMAFRSSGKSTLTGLFCAFMLMRDSSLRILVLSADQPLAEKMVRSTRRVIERHSLTRALKPSKPDQWASDRFTVNRHYEWRDPSMLARGVNGNITGMRADIIICDDVEVPKNCDSPTKRRLLREKLSEIDYVLSPDGLQLYLGTPHSHESIYLSPEEDKVKPASQPRPYEDKTEKSGAEGSVFLAGFTRLTIPLLDAQGRSAWPEKFDNVAIEKLRARHGPLKFQSQMLLTPVPDKGYRLKPSHLIRYDAPLEMFESNGEQILRIGDIRMLSVSCFWDPAYGGSLSGDGSVVACLFTGERPGYWLHHIAWLKPDPKIDLDEARQQCLQLGDIVQQFHLPAVRVETNGIGKFLPGLLKQTFRENHVSCAVIESFSHHSKTRRILDAFDPVLAARALRVHDSVFQSDFCTEMREWRPDVPKGRDDAIDAVAHCLLHEPVRFPFIPPATPGIRPGWQKGNLNAKTGFDIWKK